MAISYSISSLTALQKHQKLSPRHIAVNVLCRAYKTRQPVKPLLEQAYRRQKLDARDRGLTMQLIYGVLRSRQQLDRMLEILSSTPLKKLDPFIHQCLAIGLYQLFFLEKIPDSAAVNEMVTCCRVAGKPKRLHGFVNGNLRSAIRRKKELLLLSQTGKDKGPVLNHPRWLTDRWAGRYGQGRMEEICAANNREPSLVVRVNTARISRQEFLSRLQAEEIACTLGKYSPEAVVLQDFRGSIPSLPGFTEGFFQVQDEATQLATRLLLPLGQGGRYLDGCAGLGGKTSHLVQLGDKLQVEIHAVEPNGNRVERLRDNLQRLYGHHDVRVHPVTLQQAARDLSRSGEFDGILLDAPCSGTGVIGRHPDIRWNRWEQDLATYSALQQELLTEAAKLLRLRGTLVYATCSLEPEENLMVIHSFLKNHPNFNLTDCSDLLPHTCCEFIIDGCFQPLPSKEIDGFFCARLTRS